MSTSDRTTGNKTLTPYGDDRSLHELAAANHIDRRTNIRVRYPTAGGLGHLPSVKFEGQSVIPKNISIGGLCIEDLENQFGQQVGQEVVVHLDWGHYQTQLQAKMVGVNLQLRHIQFIDIDHKALGLLRKIIAPGYVAEKMRRVKHEESHLRLSVEEIWLGDGGETLIFHFPNSADRWGAELHLFSHEVAVSSEFIQIKKKYKSKKDIRKTDLIKDILLVLGHLNETSTRVDNLIQRLSSEEL